MTEQEENKIQPETTVLPPETAATATVSTGQKSPENKPAEKQAAEPTIKKTKRHRPKNLGFKISAILLATLMWVYVTASQNPLTEATYTIPVEQRNLAANLALLEQNYQVQVRVQGNAAIINTLSTKNFEAYIDLNGVMAGEATLNIQVDMPDTVQLVSLSPESIDVTLEEVVEGVFPLELKTLGQTTEGYNLMDAVLTPSQITLAGPQDYMKQVASVFVNADVTDLSNSYNQNLSVEVLDAAGNNISNWFTITPETCNVVIPIAYSQPEKSVAVSAAISGKPATGYQVSRIVIEPATVKALGSLEYLEKLYYIETKPIDINGLKESVSRTVDLSPPNNISLVTTTVTVAIQIEPVSTATFAKDLIYIEGLDDHLQATLSTLSTDITVSGPDTAIDQLQTTDVIPYVDCSSITQPGIYTLPVEVSLPANTNLVGAVPAQVSVTVTANTSQTPSDTTDGTEGQNNQ